MAISVSYHLAVGFWQKNYPGCELENIRFPKLSRSKGLLYALFVSLPGYILRKANNRWTRRTQAVISVAQGLLFLNFIARNGPIDFTHWLFNIRYSPVDPSRRRFLDNEYLNKTVIWSYFVKVFLTLLPVFQRSVFPAIAQKLYLYSSYIGPFMSSGNFDESEFSKCVVCGDSRPSNVIKNDPCGHLFCFYCSKLLGTRKCPK